MKRRTYLSRKALDGLKERDDHRRYADRDEGEQKAHRRRNDPKGSGDPHLPCERRVHRHHGDDGDRELRLVDGEELRDEQRPRVDRHCREDLHIVGGEEFPAELPDAADHHAEDDRGVENRKEFGRTGDKIGLSVRLDVNIHSDESSEEDDEQRDDGGGEQEAQEKAEEIELPRLEHRAAFLSPLTEQSFDDARLDAAHLCRLSCLHSLRCFRGLRRLRSTRRPFFIFPHFLLVHCVRNTPQSQNSDCLRRWTSHQARSLGAPF